jgi:hypothetical protein
VSFIDGRANLKLQPYPLSGKPDIGADMVPRPVLTRTGHRPEWASAPQHLNSEQFRPQGPADPAPGRLPDAANRLSRGSRCYDGGGTWGGRPRGRARRNALRIYPSRNVQSCRYVQRPLAQMAVANLRLPEKYCAWPPHPSHPPIPLQRYTSYDRTLWRVSRSNVLLDISDQLSRNARDCNRVRQSGLAGD